MSSVSLCSSHDHQHHQRASPSLTLSRSRLSLFVGFRSRYLGIDWSSRLVLNKVQYFISATKAVSLQASRLILSLITMKLKACSPQRSKRSIEAELTTRRLLARCWILQRWGRDIGLSTRRLNLSHSICGKSSSWDHPSSATSSNYLSSKISIL